MRPARAPAADDRPQVTQEQVSLSLIDIVEELTNHVPATRRPQVELLCRLAREKPDQHTKVKENILIVAGADAMRAAVAALLRKGRQASPQPPQAPAQSVPPAPAWSNGEEPTMPPNLPAIFGSTASTPHELQAFKAELLHAFHCCKPACPVSGCSVLATKLQRLRSHVAECQQPPDGCLLCSIFGYLRDFKPPTASPERRASDDALGRAEAACVPCAGGLGGDLMYQDELLASQQLLPCWDPARGKLSWRRPADALQSVMDLTGADGAGGAAAGSEGARAAKRSRTGGGGSGGNLSALDSYPGLTQGVLQTPLWRLPPLGAGLGGQLGSHAAMPRVPNAMAPAPSAAAPASALPLPESLDFARMTSEMYGTADMLGAGRGTKRGLGGDMMHPLPLEASKSGNLSSLNLGELLRSTSMSELGLGGSLRDLDALGLSGLSFTKGASELREVNGSELSLSGILGDNAADLVANLGAAPARRPATKQEQLSEIMSDFGAGACASVSSVA